MKNETSGRLELWDVSNPTIPSPPTSPSYNVLTNYISLPKHTTIGTFTPSLTVWSDRYWLVAVDELGQERFRLSHQDGARSGSPQRPIECKNLGSLFLFNVGDTVVAVDALRANVSRQDVLWPANYRESADSQQRYRRATGEVTEREVAHWSQKMPDLNGLKVSGLGPVSTNGAVYLESNKLSCVDPLTGDVAWSRTDIKPNATIWGDDEFVFVLEGTNEARVFDVIDGREHDRRRVPVRSEHWEYFGRCVLRTESGETNTKHLALFDPITGEDKWRAEFHKDAVGFVQKQYFASIDPDGRCKILQIDDGATIVDQQLELRELPHQLDLLESNERLFLLVSYDQWKADPVVKIESLSPNEGRIRDARLFSFSRASGESLWQSPVIIDRFAVPPMQPSELPVLLVQRKVGGKTSTVRRLETVCIDKRDGRVILELKNQPVTRIGYNIQGDPTSKMVSLRLANNKTYTIRFTEKPRAPEPPAKITIEHDPEDFKSPNRRNRQLPIPNLPDLPQPPNR